jgi:aldose 1-epimerase
MESEIMAYTVRTRPADVPEGQDPTVFVLEDNQGSIAEVWPALGFNCFRWAVMHQGKLLEMLYTDPALFANGRPTRSGIPVLFPFPNRIRGGRFCWNEHYFQLPMNDPAQKNAIHGFACRKPWHVTDSGADDDSAWIRGVFRCSIDAPECLPLWPADHQLTLTIRLGRGKLRLEAEVRNPDTVALPFGLGYHPYFRLPFVPTDSADDYGIEVPAAEYWALEENLPTGERRPADGSRDLNQPRRFADLQLDDVLTALPARPARVDGLIERGTIASPTGTLRVFCSPEFREMVVFTPPHRQAFCIEPYTCTTDAVNLYATGYDAGWQVLAPHETWSSVVELWV